VAGRKPAPQDGGAGGLVYSRFNHPNTEIVEDRLALFDGAERALVTSSGMAAIAAVFLTHCRPGDAIVHYTPLYGGTETLLGKVMTGWGIKPIPFVDGLSDSMLLYALEKAARHGPVKIVYLETPANPTNALIDLQMVRRVVDEWSSVSGQTPIIVCDNTMLGPVFQNPIRHGVDICVYSMTKYIGGHSDLIAGGITGSAALLKPIRQSRSAFGFQLDPHSSWMLARSMETLTLRMERAAETGVKVADWLANNSPIPCKIRPSARSMPANAAAPVRHFPWWSRMTGHWRFASSTVYNCSSWRSAWVARNLWSVIQPRPRIVTEGLIRLSVGLEHPDDLIADLRIALDKAARG